MKKVVAAFSLFFMVAEINFPVEARLNLLQKIGDTVKGRKSDDTTKSIDDILNAIKGLGSSFGSSGGAQIKYVNNKFLTTDSDLTFLITYSSFAKNVEIFFSLLETLLTRIRTEYTTLLGARNRSQKTKNEQTRQNQDDKVELSQSNMQRCMEILMSNGFQALQTNLQSSSVVLLRVLQESDKVPDANQQTVIKQIDALNKKCSLEKFTYISKNLSSNLSSVTEISEFSEDIDSKTETLIKNISLVRNVLGILNRYVTGTDFSTDNEKTEIDEILSTIDCYSGSDSDRYKEVDKKFSGSDEDDDELFDDEDYSDEDDQ